MTAEHTHACSTCGTAHPCAEPCPTDSRRRGMPIRCAACRLRRRLLDADAGRLRDGGELAADLPDRGAPR
jgi:hypothetical protein